MRDASIWAIPALHDNYIWAIQRDNSIVIVDPGEASAVLPVLESQSLELSAVLVTHHHWDHVGGLREILRTHPVPVYGPAVDLQRVPQITRGLQSGDHIHLEDVELALDILEVPGHTLDHIAYFGEFEGKPIIFCGDTLFSAGCGRLFEGDPPTMHNSLQKLAALPADTAVYCTHEYTEANLTFAENVEPDNPQINIQRDKVRALRNENKPSLPSTIGRELEINPFMRCDQPAVQQAAEAFAGHPLSSQADTFAAIRKWKDNF